jgi:hypothetical protein
VTSLVIKPTELQVGTVSDRRVRTIGVDADGQYAVLATAPQTHPTFGGFYLSEIQDQDPAVLLRGLACSAWSVRRGTAAVGVRASALHAPRRSRLVSPLRRLRERLSAC